MSIQTGPRVLSHSTPVAKRISFDLFGVVRDSGVGTAPADGASTTTWDDGGANMGIPVPHEILEKAAQRYAYNVGERRRKPEGAPLHPRVITISRQYGAGGRQVARLLSQVLGWIVWDKEILNVLATEGEGRYQQKMFESLDERAQGEVEAVLSAAFGQLDKHMYYYLLPKAIYTIAQDDAIVLGRGAHRFLPNSLKIRLKASVQTRVRNLVTLYELSEKEALDTVHKTDRERSGFMRELGKSLGHLPTMEDEPEFDLEISTDRLDFEGAAGVVLAAAARKFGIDL